MVPTDGEAMGMADARSEGAPISATQLAALVEMIGPEMSEVVVDILDTYIEESETLIAALEQANSAGQTPDMLRPAHSLKSSSASVGAMRLSALSAQLEAHARGHHDELDASAQIRAIRQEYGRVCGALEAEKQRLRGV